MTAEKTTASDAYGTREQKTRTFRYDAINRLSEVSENGKCLQKNVYDAEGLRSEMEENDKLVRFLYDGDKVVAERDDTKGLKRYIRGYELVSSDCEQARTYYHYASDELGSITDVLNYKGEVLNHYEYDAFGEFSVREEQVENRFAFAGEQFDPATNLYYLRARFYNPVIGRFIQEDTYYGDGLNLYAYCHNNPVGYVDPSGHDACPAHEVAVAELQKKGMSPEQAEKAYRKLREQGYTPEQIKNGDYKSGRKAELGNKLDYQFGKAGGNKHNIDRTNGLKAEMDKLGFADTAENRAYFEKYYNDVLNDSSNIVGVPQTASYTENGVTHYYTVTTRESFLMGKYGGAKVTTHWDGDRLLTIKIGSGKQTRYNP